ncbi:HEPN domain-containing protein, partial [Rickettsiales bacterium]|nr:HEPN domain-containing protein [Rickettsiales bacterium]
KNKLSEEKDHKNEEARKIAQKNFDEWFKSATEFFIDYENAFDRGSYKKASFELHQAAEHALKTISLVFTNYCPNEHYLQWIQDNIENYYPQINDFFRTDKKEEKKRVLLLEYAYIGGRYDPDFHISKEDLEILEIDVKRLLEVTKKICKEEIENRSPLTIKK